MLFLEQIQSLPRGHMVRPPCQLTFPTSQASDWPFHLRCNSLPWWYSLTSFCMTRWVVNDILGFCRINSPLIAKYRRRQWHPTPVLLPGKSHGRRSLVGCSPWGRDWATSLSLFTFIHWRKKWQPTPEFLAGESQGRRSLVGCRLHGHTESDTTEAT